MPANLGVYPGTFDPPTNGHVDLAQRSAKIFNQLIIAISNNPSKKPLFSIEERMKMLTDIFSNTPNIRIMSFSGLLVDFITEMNADAIVRGLRAVSDFEYELQLASFNKLLNTRIETVFLMANDENLFVSSSIIKEISQFGGDVSSKVPAVVWKKLQAKFNV